MPANQKEIDAFVLDMMDKLGGAAQARPRRCGVIYIENLQLVNLNVPPDRGPAGEEKGGDG